MANKMPPLKSLDSLLNDDIINFKSYRDKNRLKIYYVKKSNRLKVKKRVLELTNEEEFRNFKQELEKHLQELRQKRPKRLLLFANPYGGKGKALQVFKQEVRPLLQLAQCDYELIVTQHANHAREMIEDASFKLDHFDGIIGIGGDGMFSELMNGLLFRFNNNNFHQANSITTSSEENNNDFHDDTENQLFESPPIPIGIISAGSTDANSFGFTGTNDVITATLNIILSNQIKIDVCSLHSLKGDKLFKFASTFAAYGYFGDVVRESEKLRWLGPSRYDVTGFNTLLKHKTYKGRLRIFVSDSDGTPHGDDFCHSDCEICRLGSQVEANAKCLPEMEPETETRRDAKTINLEDTANRPQLSDNKSEQKCHYENNNNNDCKQPHQVIIQKKSQSKPLRLIELEGPFVGVNAAVTACRCPKTRKGFSPSQHLGNGCADLIVIRRCSRLQYLRYLLRTIGTNKSPFDLDCVEAFRCREFEFIAAEEDDDATSCRHQLYNQMTTTTTFKEPAGNNIGADQVTDDEGLPASCEPSETGGSTASSSKSNSMERSLGGSEISNKSTQSSWNVDGEVLKEYSIRVRVNNKLLRVFGTGELRNTSD